MFEALARLASDKDTKKALVAIGIVGGLFLIVKSYHELKLTKLRIKQLEGGKE